MGVISSQKQLVLTSLNYSGILLSPFEFFSEDFFEEEERLSNCFRILLEDSILNFDPKTYKWGLGKIDKDLQKDRYTPIYRKDAGIVDGKLIDEKTFRSMWDIQYTKSVGVMKVPPTPEQRKACQNFDLMCYHAILMYLYGIKGSDKAPAENPQKYQALMKKYFAKSFLDEGEKIRRTLSAMESQEVDIFLLQETTEELLAKVNKSVFHVEKSKIGNSCIVVRKSKFQKIHDTDKIFSTISEDLRKELNWNENTAFCFCDKFIIFSLHLSSKKEKNADQVKGMLQSLAKLQAHFPMCEIIAGGDANSFIDPASIPKGWNIYPNMDKEITTMKKRTWIQPQTNKANQLAATCRDHLLTTIPLKDPKITTILGATSDKVKYIPNQEHPCDHFVISAKIALPKSS